MFLDSETEVSVVGEVLLPQLVLTDLEATLKDLLGLGAPTKEIYSFKKSYYRQFYSEAKNRISFIGSGSVLMKQIRIRLRPFKLPAESLSLTY